jgi:hypothetical protein
MCFTARKICKKPNLGIRIKELQGIAGGRVGTRLGLSVAEKVNPVTSRLTGVNVPVAKSSNWSVLGDPDPPTGEVMRVILLVRWPAPYTKLL